MLLMGSQSWKTPLIVSWDKLELLRLHVYLIKGRIFLRLSSWPFNIYVKPTKQHISFWLKWFQILTMCYDATCVSALNFNFTPFSVKLHITHKPKNNRGGTLGEEEEAKEVFNKSFIIKTCGFIAQRQTFKL